MIVVNHINTLDYVSKSNLPVSDYVINPYVGCTHACKYCYACFMKRFSGHNEEWGTFLDIKHCDKPISVKKLTNKSVFLSSVTDCYNQFEKKYMITRKILEQLVDIDCELGISTKSKLILRDLDLLKKCKHLKVSISLNTLDEKFKDDMDNASSIKDRLETLKILHSEGIYAVLFISPIFPGITNVLDIINEAKDYVDEFWFENLNLRGDYKAKILSYVNENNPNLTKLYNEIYIEKNLEYWRFLEKDLEAYCKNNNINYKNFFYHEKLVKAKLDSKKNMDFKIK